mmetsp:Transcript_78592/g.230589  ORF Transcript_78592/g.230589 Transcript_78592/m.230589 type:complete len:631 (-) Transcript_78592:141-2033(-)
MEKRSWSDYDDAIIGPDEKRPRSSSLEESGGDEGLLEAEFYMEQRLVGWIIGRSGATLKEIEQAYNVKITVDQSTKESGFSKMKVCGPASLVQQAAEHMNTSLARAVVGRNEGGYQSAIGPFLMDTPPGPGPEMYEELHIEQKFVGWLLGKSGTVVREIETQSGCKISMNQGTRSMGFTVAQLHGSEEQRASARELMEASLERAKAAGTGGSPRLAEEDLQVEQRWVGWLLGKGGGLAKEIEQESGARITIDQSTKSLGYSTVKIVGEVQQVEAAKARVTSSLQKVGGAPLATASRSNSDTGSGDMQVQIDQQWIGWLLGKGGTVVKEIEAASGGAKISINQDTKALGYSIATINGTPEQTAVAFEQIGEKLRRVNPSGEGLVRISNGGNELGGIGSTGSQAAGAALTGIAQQIAASISRAQGQQGSDVASNLLRNVLSLLEPSSALSAIELKIEQKWVGWLLGSGGKTVKELEAETGAKISIDQSCKDMGFSTVKVSGSAMSIQLAQQRIQASLSLVTPTTSSAAPAAPADGLAALSKVAAAATEAFSGQNPETEMQVEQKWVGWLLGKAGVVLKEIELQSGASVKIDQSTKDMGYSTVRISGDVQQTASARQLIQDKISQAHPGGPRP